MSTTATTISRSTQLRLDSDAAFEGPIDMSDLSEAAEAPSSLADVSCWRLLTARIPLTLLVDLALPVERFDDVHDEMLAEASSVDWIPEQRR